MSDDPGAPPVLGPSGWHTLQTVPIGAPDALPDGDYADPDAMLPEQRIYANAVNSAIRAYNQAVRKAAAERDEAIQEAMQICQAVLKIRADNKYSVNLDRDSE